MATIDELIKTTPEAAITELTIKTVTVPANTGLEKEYDSTKHPITDSTLRPDKTVTTDAGTKLVKVTRIAIPMQQLIVNRAVSFLLGNPITIKANAEGDNQIAVLQMLKDILKKNKMKYKDKQILRILKTECEVAELWYYTEELGFWNWLKTKFSFLGDVKLNTHVRILSPSKGDILYPHFDATGKMDAFSREYSIKTGDKTVKHFDVYTDLFTYYFVLLK